MTTITPRFQGPHQGQPVLQAGAPLATAKAAMILLHGRGATAQDILTLVPELNQPEFAYFAPQASENTWYPYSFLAPISQNEPGISSGLQAISDVLRQLSENGFPPERVMLLGFSQGGCLTLEFAARHAQRFGGVVGLSAGLIGPEGTPREYSGSFDGTPIFLGCSDNDVHIPSARFNDTALVLGKLNAQVTTRLYPDFGHAIHSDEIRFVQQMMHALVKK